MNHVLSLPASDSTVERVNGSSLRRRLNGLERKHVLWGEPFFLGEAQNIVACAANGTFVQVLSPTFEDLLFTH